ncbi:cytochrome c [Frigidibacter sp. MR17.14]|uniref:c-type cytochrome n=1 Tax=Frigidibacter sp. MR17.14 TaxID=3126509 RepID=UPI003012D1F1
MQEEGLRHMAGAQVGPWYAPNITSDPVAGIGSWSKDEIVAYLATGRAEGKAQAGGSMAEAVSHSFAKLAPADLGAIATYIKEVPPVGGPARFGQGAPENLSAGFRGLDAPADPTSTTAGAQIYLANCASCHGYNDQGTRDQYYPSLFNNSVTAGKATGNMIAAVLNGVDRKTEAGHVFMPPFGTQPNAYTTLSDDEIAALATYVVAQYDDAGHRVTAAEVATIRAGGPRSRIVGVVRGLMAAGTVLAVIVAVALAMLQRRRDAMRAA